LGNIAFKGKLMTAGTLLFPGLILVWVVMRWIPLSMLLLAGIGFFQVVFNNMSHVLLQTCVADELRGRAMSIYSVAWFGLQPMGALLIGSVAEIAGEPLSVACSAAVALLYAVWLFFGIPRIRALE
jgi:hypothetical protein